MKQYTLTLRFTNGESHTVDTTDRSLIEDLTEAALKQVTCTGYTLSWTELSTFLEQRDQEST